jgi:FixJ family two-component response regulator
MRKTSHIYVIDDDPSARNGISRLLRAAGHDVQSFASGSLFLAASTAGMTGCVILDARMPGLSGAELASELKVRGIELPLIFVTADDDPKTKQLALDMGASGFFRKPVDGTALLDAVDWALRK